MWQNSKCDSGWFHEFEFLRTFTDGVEEVCKRCGKTEFFRHCDPNERYLSYHLRSCLQPWQAEFLIEYPNFIK